MGKKFNTSEEYDKVIKICRDIFTKKMHDYGCSWRILRPTSITDQIFIKAQRIRSIEEKGNALVNEGIENEYIGIINYAIMGNIQLELGASYGDDDRDFIAKKYDSYFQNAKSLMENKNHDYDEAWREMRVTSYTDMILQKIRRTKEIEDNNGKVLISEGIDANYNDMINYSVFALIKLVIEK